MNTYTIKITARDGRDRINTLLTNNETGESREEQWERLENCWIWQDGWGDIGNGLYQTLYVNCERTDAILTELEASYSEQMEFEA